MSDLTGKKALVTGGSRGIGAAIAVALAKRGADVAISFERSAERAAKVAQKIEATGQRAFAIKADNSDPAAITQLVEEAVRQLGGIDILVNNAGIARADKVEVISLEDIDQLLHVNLRGTILTTQAVIPHLPDGGRVITIGSSLAERVPLLGIAIYASTKSGHVAFTRGLARELGPRNITVNLVQPGPIDTDQNPDQGEQAKINRELTALGRYGSADELAAAVAFVASPAASYMTGSVMTVDGGYNA